MGLLVLSVALAITLNIVSATIAPIIALNDGNKMPVLALGTYNGFQKGDEEIRQAVIWAIEDGYRHIDTATFYKNEDEVGKGIADVINRGLVKREDLFITTKLWSDQHARAKVVPALKESLKQLDLDYVDLYLVHLPIAVKSDSSPDNIDYLETWQGMEDAKELGLVKSIGVSNFNATQIYRLIANSKVKPVTNQIEVNPTLTQESLVSHCQKAGLAVMAYSPFGFMVTRNAYFHSKSIGETGLPPPRVDDPVLVKMADKYGKTTTQIVLRYLIDRGLIPLPKSTNQKRIAQNIDVFDFKMTDEEVDTINKFDRNLRVIALNGYEKYPNFPF